MNSLKRAVATAQAAWAQKTVKLAPEPPGERSGTAGAERPGPAVDFVAVGDSMVAGSGVDDQAVALTPLVAQALSEKLNRPVHWKTHAQLGATMKRVHYRFLPEVSGHPDYLFVCAGTNDVLARRDMSEWRIELSASLDQAQQLAGTVVLCSAGQPHESPALPKTLRQALGKKIDEQTSVSAEVCQQRGIPFANVARVSLPEGFWAADGFHPGPIGYDFAAKQIMGALFPQG